jgi:UDP-N-acetylmuramyl pentapeptide phosphotransferase/UDP-N-acetylglucosamine-1-phosphate transferase
MLHELSMAIDLISVIAASVVGMIIGMSWYSTMLFGKEWMKLSGITPAKAKQSKKKGMGKSIGLGFIAGIVMAYVIAYILRSGCCCSYGMAWVYCNLYA